MQPGRTLLNAFVDAQRCRQVYYAFSETPDAEKARIEARKKGYSVTEQSLPSGEIKLTIQVTGGAA